MVPRGFAMTVGSQGTLHPSDPRLFHYPKTDSRLSDHQVVTRSTSVHASSLCMDLIHPLIHGKLWHNFGRKNDNLEHNRESPNRCAPSAQTCPTFRNQQPS